MGEEFFLFLFFVVDKLLIITVIKCKTINYSMNPKILPRKIIFLEILRVTKIFELINFIHKNVKYINFSELFLNRVYI